MGEGAEAADEVVRLETALASLQTTLNRIDRETAAAMDVGSAEDIQMLRLVAGQGPMRVGALAQLRGASTATASARITRLEQRGLVIRERVAGDRRAVQVSLTAAGWEAATKSFSRRRELLVVSAESPIDVGQVERLAAAIDATAEHSSAQLADPS